MEGNIEAAEGIDVLNGVFHGSPAQVREINGVIEADGDDIGAVGIRCRTPAGIGNDTDPVQWLRPVHIIDRPMDGDLAESPVSRNGR